MQGPAAALMKVTREAPKQAGTWLGVIWRPYLAFIGGLLLALAGAGLRQPLLAKLALVVLVVVACWLNQVVRDDRARGVDHGPERLAFALLQLGPGLAGLTAGWKWSGRGLDGLFFIGIALSLMSVAAIISELRQNKRWANRRGPLLLLVAIAAFVAAVLFDNLWFGGLLVGALIGEVGAELLSEDSHGWRVTQPWVVMAAGLVVLFIALGLWVASGANPVHALWLLGGLLALAWMASSDNDGLVVVLFVAIALTWATAPKAAQLDEVADITAAAGEPYFLVLGDSYISGEGASRFLEGTNRVPTNDTFTNECRQAPIAWPFRLARDAGSGRPQRVLFEGCSGAITENLHTEARLDAGGNQHGPRELALFLDKKEKRGLGEPEFIVVSIGGNDAGFGDIGQTCVGPGNCGEVAYQFLHSKNRHDADQQVNGPPGKGRPEALEFISDDLDAAYTRIKAAAPGVPVIAVPYPVPLTPTGRCRGVLLGADERHFIVGFVRELNNVIESAARRNGLLYMETMEDALLPKPDDADGEGSQLCGRVGGRAGLNFFGLNPKAGSLRDALLPTNWVHNSLHPNASGHKAMKKAALAWFRTQPSQLPVPPADPSASYQVRGTNEVIRGPVVAQCESEGRESCSLSGRRWLVDQVQGAYGVALAPVVLSLVGGWLFLAPLLWFGRQRGWSVAALALALWRRLPITS